jgi:nitrogenase molybdenum-iron protein alpha chain
MAQSVYKSIYKNTVPVREDRLNTTITYGGTASELVNVTARKCLKTKDREFSQTTFCQEWLAIFTLATIKDAVVISHAPVGCTSSLPFINIFSRFGQILRKETPLNIKWISTNLTHIEAIHGGEDKLKEAILEAGKNTIRMLFLYSLHASQGLSGRTLML